MSNKSYVSESRVRLALLHRFSDILVIPLAALLAHGVVYNTWVLDSFLALSVAMSVIIALWLYPSIGLYRAWRGESTSKELVNASQAWALNFVVLAFLLYFTQNADASRIEYFSLWFFAGLGGLLLVRSCVRVFLNRARKGGRNQTHIVIVGDNGLATSTINTIRATDWAGYNIRGYFGEGEIKNEKRLGGFHDIDKYLDKVKDRVDQVWIAMPLSKEKEINQILEELRFATQDVRLIPGIDGFRLINNSVTQVADMPVINLQVSPMNGVNQLVKAAEDRLLAAMILLCISPVMIALAIGVKLTSPGPVFYRQERVSRAGKTFMMYKFRSMPVNTEADGVQWGNAAAKANGKFGQFIRRTSLDELPQFLNVLAGDMSIVGPRPERTQFVNEFKHDIDGYMQKHMVKAGITGWAQVNGWRGDTDLVKRVEYDLYYINNWSILFDLRIIFYTFLKGFANENARQMGDYLMGVVSSRLDYALPGLVLGGAPKSGTTSLFYWLSGSPEINPAKKKESNLLVDKNSWLWETKNEDLLEAGNIYQNLFRDCGDRRINLESCAVYLYMETALKFFSSFTEAKIVFIIRNPVERFISNYRYFFNVGDGGGLDFESYLKALLAGDEVVERNEQVNDALIHGDYHRYLSRWESLLGKDRIKILIFEEMIHDPISVVAELCEWVDIDKGFLRTLDFAPQNKSYVARWKMVHKFARSLSRVFPEGEMRNKVKNIYIKANGLRQENSYVGREMLEEYYMPRNRELEVLLDRKLDIWN